jgi:hypothetical protein
VPEQTEVGGPAGGVPGYDPAYPDLCISPPPPDLDCRYVYDHGFRHITVLPPDPHNLDGNRDGVACDGGIVGRTSVGGRISDTILLVHGCSGEGVILRLIADDPEREIRGMVDPHAVGIHDKLGVQGVTNRPDAVQATAAILAADGTN